MPEGCENYTLRTDASDTVILTDTALPGAFIIDVEYFADARGGFARTFCRDEFTRAGLPATMVQAATSFNAKAGTLRGLHFQLPPHSQAKLVRAAAGAMYDVIVDLRPESPTYKQCDAVELTAQNHRMFYIPEGCAHGFQTLAEETEVFYQISNVYAPEHYGGVRWDDPAFGVRWPDADRTMIARDRDYPDFED